MNSLSFSVEGSFRDPSGYVYEIDGRILRTVNDVARQAYEAVRDQGLFRELAASRMLVSSTEVPLNERPNGLPAAAHVLEHERVPFISHPYEWSFQTLKAAALHHLDLQILLFDRNVVLSDASAYNVQFIGPKPVFIDALSLRPYRDGEIWGGHRQFCEQFLNPLLLRSILGVSHNAWFRGSLEGIRTSDLARLIPLRKKFSPNILSHVILQAHLENRALRAPEATVAKAAGRRHLSRAGYRGLLTQLRNWIARLQPADTGTTVWADYAKTNTYTGDEATEKKRTIRDFAAAVRPRSLIDIGCNTGDYSVAALEGGAESVIGFDFDQVAIDLAFLRSADGNLNFLPLWLDAANPSPDQGWRQTERGGFGRRFKADALIALAFEHHLAIAKNIPLGQVVRWLVNLAPVGIIEFVPKTDLTVTKMLALREDIFPNYTEESFAQAIERDAKIVAKTVVSSSGRTLFRYQR
jgi:ribosomal protein L11 methylase PrmA